MQALYFLLFTLVIPAFSSPILVDETFEVEMLETYSQQRFQQQRLQQQRIQQPDWYQRPHTQFPDRLPPGHHVPVSAPGIFYGFQWLYERLTR